MGRTGRSGFAEPGRVWRAFFAAGRQKPRDFRGELIEIFQLTLPDDQRAPSQPAQGPEGAAVPSPIAGDFRAPEFGPALRGGTPTAGMAVPEAAVDENGAPIARKDEVGAAGQTRFVGPVSVTESMQGFA